MKLVEAIEDYLRALTLRPAEAPDSVRWEIQTRLSITHYMLATTAFNKSNFNQAEQEFSMAIQFNPKVAEFYAGRGKSRYLLADYNGAFKDFEVCHKIDPNNVEAKNRMEQFEEQKNAESTSWLDSLGPQHGVNVSISDSIEMMLNPKGTKKLPFVRMMHHRYVFVVC